MENTHVPFSLDNGYPFVKPVSHDTYPVEDRLCGIIGIEGEQINMNKPEMEKALGLEPGVDAATFDKAFYLGMTDRVIRAEHALVEAENQITDLMKDEPFIPESFEFEKAVAPGQEIDDPVNIYKSKLASGVLITKEYGENTKWIVMKDGKKFNFDLPCKRVALCVFYAMGIEVARKTDVLEAISLPKELSHE
jgi:hypothetical protein